MNFNKYITAFISLALIIATNTGCLKKLEEVIPESSLDPTLVSMDASAAFAAYNGVYASFRGYQGTLFYLGEMRSELWANGIFTESEDGGVRQLWAHDFSPSSAPYGNWAGFYSLLNKVNTMIKVLPQTPLPVVEKSRYRGEMYGIRAYVYYFLLRTYGKVPYTVEPIKSISEDLSALYKVRTSEDSIMNLIKADIDSSLAIIGPVSYSIPANPTNAKRVYWNRAATLTLKGDVYIWSATHMGGGASDLNVAKSALEEVKANTMFGLLPNFYDVFDPNKKANNKEIIFAFNYEKDQAGLGTYGNFLVNTTQRASLIFDPPPGTPSTIVSVYPYVAGANRVGFSNATLTELLGTTPADNRMPVTFKKMHNQTSPYTFRGTMLTKFIGRADPITSSQIYDSDFPVYRFADVLLLLAEAKTKLGQDPSNEVNAIRQRAYGASYVPFVNSNEQQNMKAILDEYKREFIAEGRYWWAMRRAGNDYVFARINPTYLSAATAHKMLLPISISMLNNDPLLTQTPGY